MGFDLNVEPPPEHARDILFLFLLSICHPFLQKLDEHGGLVGFFNLTIASFSIGFHLNLEPEDTALDDVIDSTFQHDEEAPVQCTHVCSL
jgi:hypothetical protein